MFIKTNKLYIAFNFKPEYAKDVTEGGKREINNSGSDSLRLPRDSALLPSVLVKSLLSRKKVETGVQL